MMHIQKRTVLLSFVAAAVLLFAASTGEAQAQDMKKLAQVGFQFLKIEPGARGAAMGGAYAAVADNANAVFYNPAGISQISGIDASFNHTQWFADIGLNAVAAAAQFGTASYVGVSFLSVDYGQVETTIPAANEAGFIEGEAFRPGGYAVGLTYSHQFSTNFSLGGQVKYAHESLGASMVQRPGESEQFSVDNAVSGLGFDIGTLYYTGFQDLRVSMVVRNFSKELEYEMEAFQMPLTFDLGIAMNVLSLTNLGSSHKLTIAFDAIHPRDYTERMHVGAEYNFMNTFSLRTGYKFNYDTEGLSAGLGLDTDVSGFGLRADYAFTDMGSYLGNVHRISLSGSF